MSEWKPAVGDVVAVRNVLTSRPDRRHSDRDWVTAKGDLVYSYDLAPWRSAAEIAALEAVAEAARDYFDHASSRTCATDRLGYWNATTAALAALDAARKEHADD